MRGRIEACHELLDTGGHRAYFRVARRGHGPAATSEVPRDHAAHDEYWDF